MNDESENLPSRDFGVSPVGLAPVAHGGLCLPLETTADEDRNSRLWCDRERRRKALWHVAADLDRRQSRGPGLFDDGEDDDPRAVMREKWKQWCGLSDDTSAFELAWCVGAFRLLGVRIKERNGGPNVLRGERTEDQIAPVLAVLRKHRAAVVGRLAAGQPFDSRYWQLKLIERMAGGWPVWGYRLGGVTADRTRESVFPVLPNDVPPFCDTLLVYRPDCGRAIPPDAMFAVRADGEVGRRLSAGMVYVGPATAAVPEGRGAALAEERRIRQRAGYTHNPILW